ncbi:Spo0B domain-containing protein [Virgibacillus soli]
MDSNDVLRLVQGFRHDLMNQLQIMQGYATMGQSEKVQQKIDNLVQMYIEERKLFQLNTPSFTLWLMQLNWHQNIRMEYVIDLYQKNLLHYDQLLLTRFQQLVKAIEEFGDTTELYTGKILMEGSKDDQVKVSICVVGNLKDYTSFQSVLQQSGWESTKINKYYFYIP